MTRKVQSQTLTISKEITSKALLLAKLTLWKNLFKLALTSMIDMVTPILNSIIFHLLQIIKIKIARHQL